MIDFAEKFTALEFEMIGSLKLLPIDAKVKVYYGISPKGGYRLCFLSKGVSPKIDSTKLIKVSSLEENAKTHWLYLDLMDSQAKQAFFALCASLIAAVKDAITEELALVALKNRFYVWKKLFKKDTGGMSDEMCKGLFGELYFLSQVLTPKIGIANAIDAWSGPDGFSKDFSVDDTWYEIKTISAAAVVVKISSLIQLSATMVGHLVVIKVDALSEKFNGEHCCLGDLVNVVLEKITDDETREKFLEKLIKYGYGIGSSETKKFQVLAMNSYLVNSEFPRLLEEDIKYNEIGKVSYELIINTLEKYLER